MFEKYFIAGLCWTHVIPARRRPSFPSWSWTGWSGGAADICIEQDRLLQSYERDVDDGQLRYYDESQNGQLHDWKQCLDGLSTSIPYDLFEPVLHIEANTVDLRFELIEERQDWFSTFESCRGKASSPLLAVFHSNSGQYPSSAYIKEPEGCIKFMHH